MNRFIYNNINFIKNKKNNKDIANDMSLLINKKKIRVSKFRQIVNYVIKCKERYIAYILLFSMVCKYNYKLLLLLPVLYPVYIINKFIINPYIENNVIMQISL